MGRRVGDFDQAKDSNGNMGPMTPLSGALMCEHNARSHASSPDVYVDSISAGTNGCLSVMRPRLSRILLRTCVFVLVA